MAKIENIQQLRAEIQRMEGVCKQREEKLIHNIRELKEEFNPLSIILNTISSLTGVRLNRNDFLKDGIGFGISLFFQRLMKKTEKAVEHKVQDLVEMAVERVKKFFTDFTSRSEHGNKETSDGE